MFGNWAQGITMKRLFLSAALWMGSTGSVNAGVVSDIDAAFVLLGQGDEAVRVEKHQEAIGFFEAALSAIGDQYIDPAVLDDSGQKLVLAIARKNLGELPQAAAMYRAVLKVRLDMLERKVRER